MTGLRGHLFVAVVEVEIDAFKTVLFPPQISFFRASTKMTSLRGHLFVAAVEVEIDVLKAVLFPSQISFSAGRSSFFAAAKRAAIPK
jgi:hypothetical protein